MTYGVPANRITTWAAGSTNRTRPGMYSKGGIPSASWPIHSTVTASGNATTDKNNIITALSNASAAASPSTPQVVKLTGGDFHVLGAGLSGFAPFTIPSNVVLRGTFTGNFPTKLIKDDGATEWNGTTGGPGANPGPAFQIGTASYSFGTSTNLTANGNKGDISITVASAAGLSAGMFVLIDELTDSAFVAEPTDQNYPNDWERWTQVGGSEEDYRVAWKYMRQTANHAVHSGANDPNPFPPWTPGDGSYAEVFSRFDRPQGEYKEIANVNGTTITFTSPLHKDYLTAHTAQLTPPASPFTTNAGIEDLDLVGFDNGSILATGAAYCWLYRVGNSIWITGFWFQHCFRCEARRFYSRKTAVASTTGGSYAMLWDRCSSEMLYEDGISMECNKPMVARAGGAGSVAGYCYFDRSYLNYNPTWSEMAANASHFVGPHHILFEGCWAPNGDSDNTHGNTTDITFFRNHLTGFRTRFNNQNVLGGDTGVVDINDRNPFLLPPPNGCSPGSWAGPLRSAGPMNTSYGFSYVGNVLGVSDFDYTQTDACGIGWAYERTTWTGGPSIWKIGWGDDPAGLAFQDPFVAGTGVGAGFAGAIIRAGNWDWLNITGHAPGQRWEGGIPPDTIADTMYLDGKPSWWPAGHAWPGVDPTTGAAFNPAKARLEAGDPFGITQSSGNGDNTLMGQACL